MRRISLLGASGSGKTWLASQLVQALADAGQAIHVEEDAALVGLSKASQSVLLLGLDLNPPTQAQLQADQALRQALAKASVPFQVIYGQGQQRLLCALQALKLASSANSAESTAQPAKRKPWVWACEKCSDPVCEHRLLSDLLAKR